MDSIINVLTPNSLLLGRATASNPLGWQPYDARIVTRFHPPSCSVCGGGLLETLDQAVCSSISSTTARMAHCHSQLVSRRCGDCRLVLMQHVCPG